MIRFRPPRIAFLYFLIALGLHFLLPETRVIPSPYNFLGILLFGVGFSLMIWAWSLFNKAGTAIRPTEKPTALVVTGPFRLSRNPMYLAAVVMLLGAAVLLGSVPMFLAPLALFLTLQAVFIALCRFHARSALQGGTTMGARSLLFFAPTLWISTFSALAQENPGLPDADRVRLAEAFRLADRFQNDVWADWDKAPFAVLLVTPEHEFLVRHPRPSEEFTLVGYDSLLRSDVYRRDRMFSTNLLATFPAVGGIATIVVGQPSNTGKSSTLWVITMLHEHFHQLQYSQPDYYSAVEGLELSGGDETGSWMLDFPFAYDSTEVIERFSALSQSLLEAVQSADTPHFTSKLAAYMRARRRLQDALKDDDYRYFSFQLWQEGVARYTEYRIARLAAERYRPTEAFKSLGDVIPFDEAADSVYAGIITELADISLDEYRRTAFYPVGAAEALLLGVANPDWQRSYFSEKFFLDEYFKD